MPKIEKHASIAKAGFMFCVSLYSVDSRELCAKMTFLGKEYWLVGRELRQFDGQTFFTRDLAELCKVGSFKDHALSDRQKRAFIRGVSHLYNANPTLDLSLS